MVSVQHSFSYAIWMAVLLYREIFGATDCPKFTRLGCYRDNMNPRPLSEILMTDRDPSMSVYSGKSIDWVNWNSYLTDLACRCAKKTRERGFKVFGLQFFGECWSGVNAEQVYSKDGPTDDCHTYEFRPCEKGDKYCVGENSTNFVYFLNASCPTTKPVQRDKLQCTVYNLTLKLTNTTYDQSLASPQTPQFIKLRSDFEVGIMQVYDEYTPFVGVKTLRLSTASDRKVIVHFVAEFKKNGTHLPILTKALTAGILGKLAVVPKLGQIACYRAPTPLFCSIPCPSVCAPSCCSSCCQHYQQTYGVIQQLPPLPLPATCPNNCPSACAKVGCSPSCCNNVHSLPHNYYGKPHHAPEPSLSVQDSPIASYKRHGRNE